MHSQEVRILIYTTNAIEGFKHQLRKVTKAKSVFPTDDSLLKMLYLAMIDIIKNKLDDCRIGAAFTLGYPCFFCPSYVGASWMSRVR